MVTDTGEDVVSSYLPGFGTTGAAPASAGFTGGVRSSAASGRRYLISSPFAITAGSGVLYLNTYHRVSTWQLTASYRATCSG